MAVIADIWRRTLRRLSGTPCDDEQTEHFLNSVVENLPIMVFVKEAEQLRFTRWNRAAEEVIGLSRGVVLGKNDYDLFPEDQAEAFTKTDREVLRHGQFHILSEPIRTPHRGQRLLRTRKLPIFDRHGHPRFLLGMAEDITNQHLQEMHLHESEAQNRELFESSRDAIMILSPPDWRFQACNPATVAMFGARDAQHFTSLGPWDVSPTVQPDGVASAVKAPQMIERAMREGSHFFEWRHRKLDGPEFPATVLLTRISLKGQPALQATVRDITEQKRAEAELHASLLFQKTLLDNAGHAIISCKSDGLIQTFNPAAEALLGYRAEELIGQQSPALFHEREEVVARARQFSEELGTTIEPGFDVFIAKCRYNLPNEHEWTYIRRDGSRLTVLLSVTALREPNGRVTGYLGIASDITLLKQAACELLKAKEAAEAANIAKSQFLANMSHEIRTPMNGVLGMTELLQTTALSPKQRSLVDTVHRSGIALLEVINDILDFSKVEAGKLELERVEFKLRQTIEEAVELFSGPAGRKGLELTCFVPADIPDAVIGDPLRLRQIVLNLIGNAVKFTSQGEIAVTFQLVERHEATVILRGEVRDTGVGIPEAAQARLFTAFTQADGSTTRRFGGTGLGLAIVKQLVHLMGGEVGLVSRPDQGTTFWFTVTMGLAGGTALPHVNERSLGDRHILIVDDNPTNLQILENHLHNCGVGVTSAGSAQEALERLNGLRGRGRSIDMAIVDLQMPDQGGIDLARTIRQDPAWRALLLVALSSIDHFTDDKHDRHRLFDGWLRKPVRSSLLIDCLTQLFSRRLETNPEPPVKASSPPRRFDVHVLLVEDNPVNRQVASNMLELLGCTVTNAEHGRLAVEAAAARRFDVILMDCQMPEMDGFTATGLIREREQSTAPSSRVPIIALTANALEGDRAHCLAVGMDDYLSKPFTLPQLRNVLAKWCVPGSTPSDAPPPAASNTTTPHVLDQSAWQDILALQRPGRPDILARVLNEYLKDSRVLVGRIREAVEHSDPKALYEAAHRLKSSSAQLGALATAAGCAKLETLGREAHLETAPALVQELVLGHQSTCQAIEMELRARTGH